MSQGKNLSWGIGSGCSVKKNIYSVAVVLCFVCILMQAYASDSPVQTDLPDLVIELVTWSPQFPQENVNYSNTRFKITVRNVGPAPAGNFTITVAVDDMHVAMESVTRLSPGRCVTVETKSRLTRSPGSHPIKVRVDGFADSRLAAMDAPLNNKIKESDESNNIWVGTVTYLPQGGQAPQGIKPFPPHTCTDGMESEVTTPPPLSGFVRDTTTGRTVAGALVDLGSSVKATTDNRGRYVIQKLDFSPGSITVSASGYHSYIGRGSRIKPDKRTLDFYIDPLGSETIQNVGGVNFSYFDARIRKFLEQITHEGEAIQMGEYSVGEYRGEGYSFSYGLIREARNHDYYYSSSMNKEYQDASKTSLNYRGASYAPVRIHADVGGSDVTLGHFFLDTKGQILTDPAAIESLYTSIQALGVKNSCAAIDAAVQDFLDFKQELYDKRSKFKEIVGWGLALRALDDSFAIVTGIASGDIMGTAGAVFTFADSIAFYNKLSSMRQKAEDPSKTFPDWEGLNQYVIAPLKISHTAVSSVADLWPVLKSFSWKQNPGSFLDDMFIGMSWNDAWKDVLKKNQAKIGVTIATQVAELIKIIEDPDALTEKALSWEIQTCGLVAMVNKVIMVLKDAKNGVGSTSEIVRLRNLKYHCAQIAYNYGKLVQDVFQTIEDRKQSTISGWLYSRFKPVWNRLFFQGTLPSGSDLEIAKEIAKLLSGYMESGQFIKGSAQWLADAFIDDLKQTGLQTAWTLARIKAKEDIL